MNKYEKQGADFLAKHNITMTARHLGMRTYFAGDKLRRHVCRVTFMKPNGNRMTTTFGQSLAESYVYEGLNPVEAKPWVPPTAYAVLAGLEKYQPEADLKAWMRENGYDSVEGKTSVYDAFTQARTTHRACVIAWDKMVSFFTPEELDELREIN